LKENSADFKIHFSCNNNLFAKKGINAGSLTFFAVRKSQIDNSDTYTSIFSKNGTQINKWMITNVELGKDDINYDFRIAIEGRSGLGFNG